MFQYLYIVNRTDFKTAQALLYITKNCLYKTNSKNTIRCFKIYNETILK